jgi:hypothetical protein
MRDGHRSQVVAAGGTKPILLRVLVATLGAIDLTGSRNRGRGRCSHARGLSRGSGAGVRRSDRCGPRNGLGHLQGRHGRRRGTGRSRSGRYPDGRYAMRRRTRREGLRRIFFGQLSATTETELIVILIVLAALLAIDHKSPPRQGRAVRGPALAQTGRSRAIIHGAPQGSRQPDSRGLCRAAG